jgi:hypothetical protein
MKRTKSSSKNLNKKAYHQQYIKELKSAQFYLEIDMDKLPDDPDFESPKPKK